MQQAALNLNLKKTRKREFPEQMKQVVPWPALVEHTAPYHPDGRTGRPLFSLETMPCTHFMQQWFTLSDPGVEEAFFDTPIRAKVEHPFRVIKRQLGLVKVHFSRLEEEHGAALHAVQSVDCAQQIDGRCGMSAPKRGAIAQQRAKRLWPALKSTGFSEISHQIPLADKYPPASRCGGELFRPSLGFERAVPIGC